MGVGLQAMLVLASFSGPNNPQKQPLGCSTHKKRETGTALQWRDWSEYLKDWNAHVWIALALFPAHFLNTPPLSPLKAASHDIDMTEERRLQNDGHRSPESWYLKMNILGEFVSRKPLDLYLISCSLSLSDLQGVGDSGAPSQTILTNSGTVISWRNMLKEMTWELILAHVPLDLDCINRWHELLIWWLIF